MKKSSLEVANQIIAGDLNMNYDAEMKEAIRLFRALMNQLDRHRMRQRRHPTESIYLLELKDVNKAINSIMRELG